MNVKVGSPHQGGIHLSAAYQIRAGGPGQDVFPALASITHSVVWMLTRDSECLVTLQTQ
jgi:hypothetical protein